MHFRDFAGSLKLGTLERDMQPLAQIGRSPRVFAQNLSCGQDRFGTGHRRWLIVDVISNNRTYSDWRPQLLMPDRYRYAEAH